MPVAPLGTVNISALSVPQALVQIVPPQYLFNGVASNVVGLVGTAAWGPLNTPMVFGNYAQFATIYGPTAARKYDMGGHVIVGAGQGAAFFCGVRVSDGTDAAAAVIVLTSCITYTAKYSGTLGNKVKVTHGPGTLATSFKIIVSCPGLATEVFDNVGLGLTGNAMWVAIAAAINSGTTATRPASAIIIASAGAGTTALANASYTLTAGSDGFNITSGAATTMLGVDTTTRTGMYALRNQAVSQFTLCDLDDDTAWAAQLAFALDISAVAVVARAASDTLSSAATAVGTAGVDSPWIKVLFGDWGYFLDTINNVAQRIISPAAFAVGLMGNLSPQNSLLNKPIGLIIGTQSSLLGKTYSQADYQALAAARMDIIAIDKTVSNSFIFRLGLNTSSNPVTSGDQYTRVTNFLALSLAIIGAHYLGLTQTPDERRQAKVSLQDFLEQAQTNGIIGTPDGSQAYQVVLDATNNPQASVALGYQYAYVKAIYLGIVKFFIINLEGGASVVISNTPPQ